MSAKAFVFAVLIAFAAVPAFSQTPPLCKSLDPAPLIAGGILGDWKETIGKDVWFATEKGGARCSGYNSSDPACQFDDPGMVRVNVRGRDYFYAPPARDDCERDGGT